MRPTSVLVLLAALAVVPAACADDDETGSDPLSSGAVDGTVAVFAAASLTDAFTELAAAFESANPEVTVELNFAASSALREQILGGAPADVFASANPSNMDQVAEAGAIEGPPHVFVRNVLAIAVPAGNPAGITGLADFDRDELLLGLCAEEVPCGQFGREALAAVGVEPAPDTNEPDVRSLLTKVAEGELDAGIVYRTDVLADDGVEGIEIPEADNVVAEYPLAVLNEAPEPEVAAAFIEFVLADEGQEILTSYGFDEA